MALHGPVVLGGGCGHSFNTCFAAGNAAALNKAATAGERSTQREKLNRKLVMKSQFVFSKDGHSPVCQAFPSPSQS